MTRPAAPVTIEVAALDAMNFALVHNSVPLVRTLSITNSGETPLTDLKVMTELPAYARPWKEHIARLAPGATHHFEDLHFDYDETALLNAGERDRAHLRFGVWHVPEQGEPTLLAEHTEEVAVLAYNEWRRDTEPQMLASFVLPNHPATSQLLNRAKPLLAHSTGNPAMDGYQSGRARPIAQALYEALGQLEVTYANPPASFEATGQKIRTPDQVLGERLATCLDVSTLLAAAMEQLGLHPLIVIIKEQAFSGVWLHDHYRKDAGFWDPGTMRNEVALGRIIVFDSSAAVSRPAISFDQAVAEAQRMLQSDDDFRFALDVRGARAQRYLPLPSRVQAGTLEAVREVIVEKQAPQPVASGPVHIVNDSRKMGPDDPPEVQEAKARLRYWQKQLLDLGLRNRLLNFRPDGRHGLRVLCPDPSRLEDHLAAGKTLVLHAAAGVFSDADGRSLQLRRQQRGEQADEEYLLECLELHSHAARKKHVLEQMSQALHAQSNPPETWEIEAQNLVEDRTRLNDYVGALHRPRPQGAALRDGMGKLCLLRSEPRVALEFGDPSQLSRRDQAARLRRLDEVVAVARKLGPPADHPLVACRQTSSTTTISSIPLPRPTTGAAGSASSTCPSPRPTTTRVSRVRTAVRRKPWPARWSDVSVIRKSASDRSAS